MEKHGRC